MSTRIEDLPGPIPEDILGDLSNIQNTQDIRQQTEEQVKHNTIHNKQPILPEMYKDHPTDSNIKMNIKKRVKFEDENEDENKKDDNEKNDMFSFFKSQINEENALLLIVLMLASRSESDDYIKLYLKTSDILTIVVRCVLILLVYLIFKNFVLPKIKL
jgi:hypothetical protein